MDPATIVGTTSAILSFIQFSGQVISAAYKIYESSDGAVDDNQRLEEAVTDLQARLQSLRPAGVAFGSSAPKTDAEKSLLRTANQCETLGNEILEILNKSKAKVTQIDETQASSLLKRSWRRLRKDAIDLPDHPSKTTMVEAVRASIHTIWQKDKIDSLRQQWEFCVGRLNMDLQRLDTEGKQKIICKAFRNNSEQVGKIGNLLESLMQDRIPRLECLQSFLDELRGADKPRLLEQRNIESILRALEFEGMDARRDQIGDTVGNTFEWLIATDAVPHGHPELNVSFKKWLSDGTGVFHVTGKPGSGKSTLMKLIDRSETAREQLESWASRTGDRLVTARFYTWKAANAHRLQNQEEGLARTLLHQILTAAPELTKLAFAKHPCWNPQEYRLVNLLSRGQGISAKVRIEAQETLAALESLFCVQGYRFFLLIDGMDEFGKAQNHRAIGERVIQWSSRSSQRVKTCVSSREENAFMGNFSSDQRLRLHILTAWDVRQLVEARLMEHRHFVEASLLDRQRLVLKILERAEGVFLWVVLTIQELKILMDDRQSFPMLLKEVDRLPGEMEDFLREILSRIPEAYKEESKAIFSVVTTRPHEIRILTLFHYSMLRRCIEIDDADAENNPPAMGLDEVVSQIKDFRFRLPSLSKGLLETAPGPHKGTEYLYRHVSDEDNNITIQCIHRSVFDFLRNSFNNAPAAVDSRISSGCQGLLLALHSVLEVIKAIPWDEKTQQGREIGRVNEYYVKRMLDIARQELLVHPQLGNSIFPLFKTLEATILRKQGAIAATMPFDSVSSDGIRLESRPFSVFLMAFQEDFCEYIHWVLKNYPPWVLTRKAKSYAAGSYEGAFRSTRYKPAFVCQRRFYGLPVRCLTKCDWLSINEPLFARHYDYSSDLQVHQASMWVNDLLWFILHSDNECTETNVLRTDFEAALLAGAEPRIRFNWWSEAEFAAPYLDSNGLKPLFMELPGATGGHRVQTAPFGPKWGVTIEVGDTKKPELIQGPLARKPKPPAEENTRLIIFFVSRFQKTSGTATLKDLANVLLKPDITVCPYLGRALSARSYERELALRRRCHEAVDKALARVSTSPSIDTQSDLCASGGTDEDGQHPVPGEKTMSDLSDTQRIPLDGRPRRLVWFSPGYYFNGWQIVVISTLGILLPVLCTFLLPRP